MFEIKSFRINLSKLIIIPMDIIKRFSLRVVHESITSIRINLNLIFYSRKLTVLHVRWIQYTKYIDELTTRIRLFPRLNFTKC